MAISQIWYAQSNHLSENTIAERRYVIGKVCQALRATSLRNASITYQVSWFGFFSLTSRGKAFHWLCLPFFFLSLHFLRFRRWRPAESTQWRKCQNSHLDLDSLSPSGMRWTMDCASAGNCHGGFKWRRTRSEEKEEGKKRGEGKFHPKIIMMTTQKGASGRST